MDGVSEPVKARFRRRRCDDRRRSSSDGNGRTRCPCERKRLARSGLDRAVDGRPGSCAEKETTFSFRTLPDALSPLCLSPSYAAASMRLSRNRFGLTV